jgi:hypothetical protein
MYSYPLQKRLESVNKSGVGGSLGNVLEGRNGKKKMLVADKFGSMREM